MFYIQFIMSEFSIKNWENGDDNIEITDMDGALEILKICKVTLISWEKRNVIKSFKTAFNGRLRKCYRIADLKRLAGQGDPVST